MAPKSKHMTSIPILVSKDFRLLGATLMIRRHALIKLKIARYPEITQDNTRQGLAPLDIGCCCTHTLCRNTYPTLMLTGDSWKAVADGWPVENAIASDINKEFRKCGHESFK